MNQGKGCSCCKSVCPSSLAGKGVFKEILDCDTFKYYVDGEWRRSCSGHSVTINNPSTRKPLFKVQGKWILHMLKDHTILHTFEPLVMHQMGLSNFDTIMCWTTKVGSITSLKYCTHKLIFLLHQCGVNTCELQKNLRTYQDGSILLLTQFYIWFVF